MKCINCGKTFKMKFRSNEKYCSTECRKDFYKKKKARKCVICGAKLEGRQMKYCSAKCKNKNLMIYTTAQRKEDFEAMKPKAPKPRKKPRMSIDEIIVMANKEGLSYGQYVAKYGY